MLSVCGSIRCLRYELGVGDEVSVVNFDAAVHDDLFSTLSGNFSGKVIDDPLLHPYGFAVFFQSLHDYWLDLFRSAKNIGDIHIFRYVEQRRVAALPEYFFMAWVDGNYPVADFDEVPGDSVAWPLLLGRTADYRDGLRLFQNLPYLVTVVSVDHIVVFCRVEGEQTAPAAAPVWEIEPDDGR